MNFAETRWKLTGEVIAAHVEMLRRVGLIDDESADALRDAVVRVAAQPTPADPDPLNLVREFDGRIGSQTEASVASAALVGRGVIDVAATVTRMSLRIRLLELSAELNALRAALIDLAGGHLASVMPIIIDGALAQPGTIAHWLGGLIAPLGRAHDVLVSAFERVNQSPMGAGSHASSGLENDRAASSEQLGFASPASNTFDAVAAVDHFVDAADVTAHVAMPLARWLVELVVLARTEPASLRLGDRWRSSLADMPQFDGPAGIERLAVQSELVVEQANTVRALALRTPYMPLAARLGNLADAAERGHVDAKAAVAAVREFVVAGFEFNRAYLANRAGRAFSTSSDLVDFLMIEERQDPQAARSIAALTISRARELGLESSAITPELIDGAALLVIGQELKVEFEAISRYLAPRRFIERRTAVGAPSSAAVRTYLLLEREKLENDRAWRMSSAAAVRGLAPDR